MGKYQHDTERLLRSQASLYRACHNVELAGMFERCAEDVKRLKMAVDLHEHGAEHMREDNTALRARVARLEEALNGVLPPEHGEYGGPLVEMVARYEDGSPTGRITPMLAKMHIRHEAVARARRALEEK